MLASRWYLLSLLEGFGHMGKREGGRVSEYGRMGKFGCAGTLNKGILVISFNLGIYRRKALVFLLDSAIHVA